MLESALKILCFLRLSFYFEIIIDSYAVVRNHRSHALYTVSLIVVSYKISKIKSRIFTLFVIVKIENIFFMLLFCSYVYWVNQKRIWVFLKCYKKTWTNFLVNPVLTYLWPFPPIAQPLATTNLFFISIIL